ncbi:MAG TPA: type II toxin-antitoxin system VapC family toxin [Gammaproteobacteria bacterium]|nr:type II toxin-antitoxin system VapC family toxin [Gammaproteobacteria bacterium]
MATERVLLDASALLALLENEPGAAEVAAALPHAQVSAVNLAEVTAKLMEHGWSKSDIAKLHGLGLEIVPFTQDMALQAGELSPQTRRFGLSLGDRACLATALVSGTRKVLTADTAWTKTRIKPLNIVLIRSPAHTSRIRSPE